MASARVFTKLPEGTTKVVAEYSGSGDEGWINDITAYRGEEEILHTGEQYAMKQNVPPFADDVGQLLMRWVEDEIYQRCPGYENNEGGQGTITVDLTKSPPTVVHEHGTNYTETEETVHRSTLSKEVEA